MSLRRRPASAAGAPLRASLRTPLRERVRTAGTAEQGAAVTEAAIALPLLVLMVMGVVFVGRLATADGQLEGAANHAARAASLARTRTAAARAAQAAATGALAGSQPGCRRLSVTIDTSSWRAGGAVRVQVRCVVPLGSLGLLGVPGSMTRTATATVPLDRFRGIR